MEDSLCTTRPARFLHYTKRAIVSDALHQALVVTTLCHINLARGFRGGERQTELLVRELAARGVRQRLIVRRGQPLARHLQDVPGLVIREIGKPFYAHVRQAKGCFLHAHDGHGAKFAAAASLLCGSPYIVTRRVSSRPSNNFWTKTTFRRAQAVVAVAQSVADLMQDYLPSLSLGVIHSALGQLPVDTSRRDEIRSRWPGCFLIVNVAALINSVKGQKYLIEAARQLEPVRPDIRFVLLGEGRDRDMLEAEAAGLSNVVFEGFVDNVGDYLDAVDAFILPSMHEGVGSSCLDAMYFGLPVIASAVNGVPEIVKHEENGLLIPRADAKAIFEAVCRIHDDPALARRLGESGRVMANAHLPARMADQYLEVYETAGWSRQGASSGVMKT